METEPAQSTRGGAHPRRFRFGPQLSSATSGEDWVAKARRAEDLGDSSLFLPDHLGPG